VISKLFRPRKSVPLLSRPISLPPAWSLLTTTTVCGLRPSAKPAAYRALIVTEDDSESSICAAIEAGVHGYLLLGCPLDAIVRAVRCVDGGGTALDPLVAGKFISGFSGASLTAPLRP
jgi:DNA-binding NarL/FixJ family response regulator